MQSIFLYTFNIHWTQNCAEWKEHALLGALLRIVNQFRKRHHQQQCCWLVFGGPFDSSVAVGFRAEAFTGIPCVRTSTRYFLMPSRPRYSKWGLRAVVPASLGSLLEIQYLRSPTRAVNQNLHFNKTPQKSIALVNLGQRIHHTYHDKHSLL